MKVNSSAERKKSGEKSKSKSKSEKNSKSESKKESKKESENEVKKDSNNEAKQETQTSKKSDSVKDPNAKTIAVFTSGGDSQGMNAAVQAVYKMARCRGCQVYFIKEGYTGMIEGGKNFVKASSADVYGIIHKGGTVIGSSRNEEFRDKPGRLKAAYNLVQHKLTNLVVIGGDGSLTGANMLRQEWPTLLDELVSTGKIKPEQKEECNHLTIVGMVATIDNNYYGTDMTIGCDSGLHRIIEAVDATVTTALSHRRTFILEVMGYTCGYLALVGALASSADFVFIPEYPPEPDWETKLCDKLKQERELGHRLNIVIFAEGAIDRNGEKINVQTVKEAVEKTGYEARTTVLGHIQRGGITSAYDRAMASYVGAEAVTTLLEAKPGDDAKVLGIVAGKVVKLDLKESVEKTMAAVTAMKEKKWEECIKLRGKLFEESFEIYKTLARLKTQLKQKEDYKVIIIQLGTPCSGMNGAVRSFVRTIVHNGGKTMVAMDGIDGLLAGKVKPIEWADVNGWVGRIGSYLGSGHTSVDEKNVPLIVKKLNDVQALLVIGGFEAYKAVSLLSKDKDLKIPICMIPAAISNNVPGTDLSLGADTALNGITEICDRIRLSSRGTTGKVYMVELEAGYCGYLPLTATITAAAYRCYKYGDKITENQITEHAKKLKKQMQKDPRNRMIIMNGQTEANSKSPMFPGLKQSIFDIYSKEGKGVYSVKKEFLSADLQQPMNVSPFDRIFSTKIGVKAANWVHEAIQQKQKEAKDKARVVVVGLVGNEYKVEDIEKLSNNIDFEHEVPKDQWFHHMNILIYDCFSK